MEPNQKEEDYDFEYELGTIPWVSSGSLIKIVRIWLANYCFFFF